MEVLKEYLVPGLNGLTLIKNPPLVLNYYIEVPEGAEVYGKPPGSDELYFHKVIDGQNWYYSFITHQWSTSGHPVGAFDEILWYRPAHPEPLPFVDDEPPAYYGNAIRQKPRQRVYAVMGEWSPDWSQAPEWANWWCATMKGGVITGGIWCKAKPSTLCATGDYSAYQDFGRCEFAPSFGYQGNWQDSVRRRPVTVDVVVLVVPAPERINFTASK